MSSAHGYEGKAVVGGRQVRAKKGVGSPEERGRG